jgi:hypothetical protein
MIPFKTYFFKSISKPKFTISERFVGAILVIARFNPFKKMVRRFRANTRTRPSPYTCAFAEKQKNLTVDLGKYISNSNFGILRTGKHKIQAEPLR